ncbi:MAG: sugar phosphate isomerase/epimerase family protein [Pirellulales bacterium]
MYLGYNTNGFAHHDPYQAVGLLAAMGYRGVALSIDHGMLNPYERHFREQVARMRDILGRLGLRSVVETGARYLLDAHRKHEPTLLSPEPEGRALRIDFLRHAIDLAKELSSDCVSLWSGALGESLEEEKAFERLAAGLREVLDHASAQGVAIGFEPEPGMFIDTMARYERLLERIDSPEFRLTLDVGHLQCQGDVPIADQIRRWAPRLVNVHLDDARAGVHEHLMFGEGEIEFPPVVQALAEAGYQGGLHVELNRHSDRAPEAARRALEFLSALPGLGA